MHPCRVTGIMTVDNQDKKHSQLPEKYEEIPQQWLFEFINVDNETQKSQEEKTSTQFFFLTPFIHRIKIFKFVTFHNGLTSGVNSNSPNKYIFYSYSQRFLFLLYAGKKHLQFTHNCCIIIQYIFQTIQIQNYIERKIL